MNEFNRGFLYGLYASMRLLQKKKDIDSTVERIHKKIFEMLDTKIERMLENLHFFD